MTKPTISEVLLENIVKRLEEQSKFFKELKALDSAAQSVNHDVCKYKPPDKIAANYSNFYKYIAGVGLFVMLLLSGVIYQCQIKIDEREKYYYQFELVKQYNMTVEKAEKLFIQQNELVRAKIDHPKKRKEK
jgi:hypothetical protein